MTFKIEISKRFMTKVNPNTEIKQNQIFFRRTCSNFIGRKIYQ